MRASFGPRQISRKPVPNAMAPGIVVHPSRGLPDASRRASASRGRTSIALSQQIKILALQAPRCAQSSSVAAPHRLCSPASVAHPRLHNRGGVAHRLQPLRQPTSIARAGVRGTRAGTGKQPPVRHDAGAHRHDGEPRRLAGQGSTSVRGRGHPGAPHV